jgi:N-acetylglutamate synthase-like GNAT family acetyltransferase
MNITFAEGLGYAASGVVAISLLITNLWYFRWINLAGALAFSIYGLLIGSVPVAMLNGIIVAIDVYFILQMMKKVDYFHYLTVTYKDSPYLQYFLRYYVRDIGHHFPRFWPDKLSPDQKYTFVLRNAVSVGVFSYHTEGDCGVIDLDYTLPAYRDLQNTRYLIDVALADEFKQLGLKRLRTYTTVPKHSRYLEKLGFRPVSGEPGTYELMLVGAGT